MSQRLWVLLLGSLVVISALGVVYVKHQKRKLFVELQSLQSQRDHLDIDWGRLQLEQSTWATHGRLERMARKDLGMDMPRVQEVVIVRP